MARPTITGIHHITAIAGDPQRNLDFYTEVLGLRLVKLTVNFDDPGTYHFYFGDAEGSPGSILTFFPWAGIHQGTVGTGQVTATSFAVRPESLDYWQQRLEQHRVKAEPAGQRFGEAVVQFADPDGLPLEIIGDSAVRDEAVWTGGGVVSDHAIRRFHSATLSEEGYEQTAELLQGQMGFRSVGSQGNRFRYAIGAGADAAIVDVLCAPDGQTGRLGAGTVHHIAWRTPDDAQQLRWRQSLVAEEYNVSPVMDRTYFRSIYYREPGGILFEIATDPPGFTVDETVDHLGERLMLPPHVAPRRTMVELMLPHLVLPHQKREAHA